MTTQHYLKNIFFLCPPSEEGYYLFYNVAENTSLKSMRSYGGDRFTMNSFSSRLISVLFPKRSTEQQDLYKTESKVDGFKMSIAVMHSSEGTLSLLSKHEKSQLLKKKTQKTLNTSGTFMKM